MFKRYFSNTMLALLPASRFYSFKRRLLIMAGLDMAPGVKVNGHTWFYGPGRVRVGEDTWIGPRCRFYTVVPALISIGRNCDIAPEVRFIAGTHELGGKSRRAGMETCHDIAVEDGCWIGLGATLLAGVTVGAGSVIGAAALVNNDIPPGSLAAGVPARLIKKLPE